MGSTGHIMVEQQKARRRGRLGWWLAAIALVIAAVLCYNRFGYPLMISGFGNADTRPVSGDPAHFDPIAALPEVMAYAGADAQFISLDARFVRSDGTMDLTADYTPWPQADYKFVHEIPRPDNAPPPGAGGANTGPWYEPIEITAYQPGHWWSVSGTVSYQYMNQGMERETSSPQNTLYEPIIPLPTCKFADFWQAALKRDAPKDAVATISYDQYGYAFSITGMDYDMRFDANCQPGGEQAVPTAAPPG